MLVATDDVDSSLNQSFLCSSVVMVVSQLACLCAFLNTASNDTMNLWISTLLTGIARLLS